MFPFFINSTELIESILKEAISIRLGEEDLSDCFLVDLKVHTNHKIEVFIDSDEEVNFEKCRTLSRYLEAVVEDQKLMPDKYTLDVSSAGVGRPLKFERQYRKNAGRNLVVKTLDGEKIEGRIADIRNGILELEVKEKKQTTLIEVDLNNIKEAKIKVSFK